MRKVATHPESGELAQWAVALHHSRGLYSGRSADAAIPEFAGDVQSLEAARRTLIDELHRLSTELAAIEQVLDAHHAHHHPVLRAMARRRP